MYKHFDYGFKNVDTNAICYNAISSGGSCTTYDGRGNSFLGTCDSQGRCVPTANCGNGRIDTGEECDGTNLNNKQCSDLSGFSSGNLTCTSSCAFDTGNCFNKLPI